MIRQVWLIPQVGNVLVVLQIESPGVSQIAGVSNVGTVILVVEFLHGEVPDVRQTSADGQRFALRNDGDIIPLEAGDELAVLAARDKRYAAAVPAERDVGVKSEASLEGEANNVATGVASRDLND